MIADLIEAAATSDTATTRTPIGEITSWESPSRGTVHARSGPTTASYARRKAWQDHLSYIGVLGEILERAPAERFVLAGDLNQQVGQYYSAPRKYTKALGAALPERMLIATAPLGFDGRRVIDQIAVSADMAAEAPTLISKYDADRLLTDHVGVVADLTALSAPAVNTVAERR